MVEQKKAAQDSNDHTDHAGVVIPPPLAMLALLGAGITLQSHWIGGFFPIAAEFYLGALMVFAGLAILLAGATRFKAAQTSIEPWKPTSNIISHGPYGYSRNPLYVAMVLVYFGIAVAAGSYIALLTLLPGLVFLRFYVIAREEAYLERKFGAEYVDYKNRVRRWL